MTPASETGPPQLLAALICTQAELIAPGVYHLHAVNEVVVPRRGEEEEFTVVGAALFLKLRAGTFHYEDPVEIFHCNAGHERQRVAHEAAPFTKDGLSLDAIVWFSSRFDAGCHTFEIIVGEHVVATIPLRVYYPDELSPSELAARGILDTDASP